MFLSFSSERAALGATITAASTSAADVQVAINSANNGDIVVVPSGSATWNSQVTCSKAITLQGAGIGKTVITSGLNNTPSLSITTSANGPVVVSGFTFNDDAYGCYNGIITISGDNFWRVCSNYFSIGSTAVSHWGIPGGLFDNNYVKATFGAANGNPTGFSSNGQTNIWSTTVQFGTTTNWDYIEHNIFDWETGSSANGADDGYNGAAHCFRYNIVTNTWCGMHGCDSGGYRSAFADECYSNVFVNATAGNQDIAMGSRGGAGIYWGNTLIGPFNFALKLMDYRWCPTFNGCSICAQSLGGCPPWGEITGTNPVDGNIMANGWPSLDMCGYTGPTTFTGTHSIQVSSPVYYWGNNVSQASFGFSEVTADSIIEPNTNYFVNVTKPNYKQLVYPYPVAGGSPVPATNAPQITVQPASASVSVGAAATFNVTASGSGTLNYQWSWYGTNVLGATSSSWTTPATVLGNSNSIVYVSVGNAYGSVTSSIAHLFVTNGVAPSITASPASLTNAVGSSATFSVVASGTAPLAYQWFFNSGAVANATNSSYTITPVGTINAGIYTVTVTNLYGSVSSLAAILTVTASTQTIHYYYLATTGSDTTGNGSISSPWATVDHATSLMSGGDVLYIRGGTYSQIFDIYGPSGSASYPTTVEAYPGETPIFNANNIAGGAHSIDGVNWMLVSGLTIESNNIGMVVGGAGACSNIVLTNMTFADIGQQGFQIENSSYNILLLNSTVHDTGLWIYNGEGMYIGEGDSSGILDNTHNITIQGCTVYNTKDEGIELKGGTYNVTVQSNLLYSDNLDQDSYGAGGGAIEVDEEGTYNYWGSDPNQVVRGNLVYNTYIGIRAATGGQYYNNIVYACTNYGILINNTTGQPGNVNYTRYVYNNTIDEPSSIALVNSGATASILNNIGPTGAYNLATSSAYYVNAAAHNYHLVVGSAPIQAGTNVFSVVPADFDGNARPSSGPFDIGAYQYEAGDVLLPPTNLHVVSSQ